MIVIRRIQMVVLADEDRRRRILTQCKMARAQFPTELASLTALSLFRHASQVLDRAANYGLHSSEEWHRFLSLAVRYGWNFDQTPQHAWMRAWLLDARVSTPSGRLDRLLDRLEHDVDLGITQARLRSRFAQAPHPGEERPPQKANDDG